MKTYSSNSNAKRAVIKELGAHAAPGLDYNIVQHGKGKWTWEPAGNSSEAADTTQPEDYQEAVVGRVRTEPVEKDTAAEVAKAPREGSKLAKVIGMIERPNGASIHQIMLETGWLAKTVRGIISGVIRKKRGMPVLSEKNGDGVRVYSLPAAG